MTGIMPWVMMVFFSLVVLFVILVSSGWVFYCWVAATKGYAGNARKVFIVPNPLRKTAAFAVMLLALPPLWIGTAAHVLQMAASLLNSGQTSFRPAWLRGLEFPRDGWLSTVADSAGNRYLMLNSFRRIQSYDQNGVFRYGFFYDAPQIKWPLLAIDTNDRLYTGSRSSSLLFRYDTEGDPDGQWKADSFVSGGKWDGRTWALNSRGDPEPRATTPAEAAEKAEAVGVVKPGQRIFPVHDRQYNGVGFVDAGGRVLRGADGPLTPLGKIMLSPWTLEVGALVMMFLGTGLLGLRLDIIEKEPA